MHVEIQLNPVDDSMLPALADLCGQLGYPTEQDQLAFRLQQILTQSNHFLRAAQLDGIICGLVHAHMVDLLTSARCVEVAGLIVSEVYRQHGIGRALMGQVEDWANQQDINLIYLRSNIIRKEAHQFYKSIGYECIKQHLTFRKTIPSRTG